MLKAGQILYGLIGVSLLTYISYFHFNPVDHTNLESKVMTIHDQTTCEAKCTQECSPTDMKCFQGAMEYGQCIAFNGDCEQYETFKSNADVHDPLPQIWYDCQKQCKPSTSSEFDKHYECIVACGN